MYLVTSNKQPYSNNSAILEPHISFYYATMDDYPAAEPIPNPTVEFSFHELMEFLQNNQDMRQTGTQSLKQGLMAGGGAVAGGLLFGPVGGLLGGIVGSLAGFWSVSDYDGAVQQILRVNDVHKRQLVEQVYSILKQAGASATNFDSPEAFRATLADFAGQPAVRDQVWRACLSSIDSRE